MGTAKSQANFLLPDDLIEDLRLNVPKREQSKIVAEAIRKELKRLRLQKAIQTSFGAWKDEDHPELKAGTDKFIRKLRVSTRMKTK